MSITDKLWDSITTVMRMNDKVERMSAQVVIQAQKIEDLTGRIIRLETALELGMAMSRLQAGHQIENKG
ncbi:MAG: hypothetical protein HY066_07060 [Betaproteobacteria bacterium]|nr:hypothetical protein [Betaproteobacteria bacterium]